MTITFEWAVTICVGIFLIGSIVSVLTKFRIPTMLTAAALFLIGFWTILPQDIIQVSGLKSVYDICFLVVLIHVGAMFEWEALKKDWKIAVVAVTGVLAIILLVTPVGGLIFGKNVAVCAVPPLTGGGIAGILMMDAANTKGATQAALMAMMIMTLQMFPGFLLTGMNLRKEAARRLQVGLIGSTAKADEVQIQAKVRLIDKVPEKFKDTTFHFFSCCLLGALAYFLGNYTSAVTGGIINKSILAIVFGILANFLGIVEKRPLEKSGSYAFLMLGLNIGIMDNLKAVTPEMLVDTLIPFVGVFVIATIGIWILCPVVGKKLEFSPAFSRAIGFNCFLGYPFNHQITIESIKAVTKDSKEQKLLEDELLPAMILSGVVSVSVASVFVAGVFVGLL